MKASGPGLIASGAEIGLELEGSPDGPHSFSTGHLLRRTQDRGLGRGKKKRGLGAWGQSDKRYVGSSRLLIRDPQCHSKGIFYQDVIFPAADTIFFLVQTMLAFAIRRLDMFTLRQPKHEAGGKKFPS